MKQASQFASCDTVISILWVKSWYWFITWSYNLNVYLVSGSILCIEPVSMGPGSLAIPTLSSLLWLFFFFLLFPHFATLRSCVSAEYVELHKTVTSSRVCETQLLILCQRHIPVNRWWSCCSYTHRLAWKLTFWWSHSPIFEMDTQIIRQVPSPFLSASARTLGLNCLMRSHE